MEDVLGFERSRGAALLLPVLRDAQIDAGDQAAAVRQHMQPEKKG